MIFTLGVDTVMRGLMVAHTGGFAPQTDATPLMRSLAAGKIAGIPIAIFVWAGVSLARRDHPLPHRLRPLDLRHRHRARAPPTSPASAPAS